MACPRCRNSQLVEINLTVGGEQVTMRSCSRCETRWWEHDGEPMSLEHVRALAAPGKERFGAT